MHVGEVRFSLGTRLEVLETAATTGGQRFTVRTVSSPQRRFPPLHWHPHQTETFTVRAGHLTVRWLREQRTYAAGDTFQVLPGTAHTMRSSGQEAAVVDWSITPPLRSEELFGHIYGTRPRLPLADVLTFVWQVAVSRRFRAEMVLAHVPGAGRASAGGGKQNIHAGHAPSGDARSAAVSLSSGGVPFWIPPVLLLLGAAHLGIGVLFFCAPAWAFAHVAHFPPFNAHFLADIGAFNLPLGVGLLLAARAPRQQRTVIGLAALGDLAHALSHLRDHALHAPPAMSVLAGTLTQSSTLLSALLLLAAALWLRPRSL